MKKEFIRVLILRTIGNFLILFMLFGFITTFAPALYFEATYRVDKMKGISYRLPETESELGKLLRKNNNQTSASPSLLGNLIAKGNSQQILVPPSTQFSVVIPKIGAAKQVFPNIDPTNEKEYLNVLEKGVAHAKGSAFPGMNGTTYLFAHSADNFWNVGRYNAVFYLLKDLEKGDQVVVFFQNKRYNYIVTDKKIAEANEVNFLQSNVGKGEELVLQTCWPPGTTWKRLFVIAKPKN